jgi:hypothetical protein
LYETENELKNNPELQSTVSKMVVVDKIKETAKYDYEISTVDIIYELQCFLSRGKISETTKKITKNG